MLTAVAIQGFQLFVEHLTAAIDGIDDPLRSPPCQRPCPREFTDLHPGHCDIMFRPTLINTHDPDYKDAATTAPSPSPPGLSSTASPFYAGKDPSQTVCQTHHPRRRSRRPEPSTSLTSTK
jgi:hypothetical protein